MAIKKLEDFNHDVEVHKAVLASMPINNAKNLKVFKEKVAELIDEYSYYKEQLYEEINRRSNKYLKMKPNSKIESLKESLLGFKDLSLFNPINTSFEKLGLDNILYSLNHYFKNDLTAVNADIKKVFDLFKEAGIELTDKDFAYSMYAKAYIHELLKDDDIERMKDVFEDLHWKCPDVILHIEMNIRILFYKNIKSFNNYLENKKRNILNNNLSYDDCIIKRDNIIKEIDFLEEYDTAAIVSNFMNGKLTLNDYSKVNVDKCYAKFLGENVQLSSAKEMIEEFKNLYYNLNEYRSYLKYEFVLDDLKKKIAEKGSHLGNAAKILKEISSLESELASINASINTGKGKGFLFFKKKVDVDKLYVTLNEKIRELDKKYDEYDDELIYEKINESLSETSSIYDAFKFVLSFKGYLRKCIKAQDENVNLEYVKQVVKEFDLFINSPTLNVLKNLSLGVDNNVALIISDHYKLLNIKVDKDNIGIEEIENLLKDLKIIINSYYLEDSGLDIGFILELFESKKIIEAREKAS